MKRMVTFLSVLAIILSLSACQTKDSPSTEQAPEETVTDLPKEIDEPEDPELSEYEQAKQSILEYVDVAYTGMTAADATMYFMSDSEGEFTVLMLVNADGKSYINYVGESTIDEDTGILTVTDDDTGYSFEFTAEKQSDGLFLLDCGNLGRAYLEADEPGDVMDNIMDAYQTMEDVTEEFADAMAQIAFMDSLDVAYIGLTAVEAPMFFLASSDGEFAALVMVGSTGESYISFVGTAYFDEETDVLTIVDSETGNWFGFIAEAQEDGSFFLDCGEFGECYLQPEEIGVVIDYIDAVFMELDDVTDSVIAQVAN